MSDLQLEPVDTQAQPADGYAAPAAIEPVPEAPCSDGPPHSAAHEESAANTIDTQPSVPEANEHTPAHQPESSASAAPAQADQSAAYDPNMLLFPPDDNAPAEESCHAPRCYFVDFENVSSSGLNGIDMVGEQDMVCIFYSENANSLTFELHRQLCASAADIQYQKVEVGLKDALDFQLSSYLGYMIGQNLQWGLIDVEYYIISKDQGFRCLENYWRERNVTIFQVESISSLFGATPSRRQRPRTRHDMSSVLAKMLPNKHDAAFVSDCIRYCTTKQEVNNALMQRYRDSQKVGSIYRLIKPMISDLKPE